MGSQAPLDLQGKEQEWRQRLMSVVTGESPALYGQDTGKGLGLHGIGILLAASSSSSALGYPHAVINQTQVQPTHH